MNEWLYCNKIYLFFVLYLSNKYASQNIKIFKITNILLKINKRIQTNQQKSLMIGSIFIFVILCRIIISTTLKCNNCNLRFIIKLRVISCLRRPATIRNFAGLFTRSTTTDRHTYIGPALSN